MMRSRKQRKQTVWLTALFGSAVLLFAAFVMGPRVRPAPAMAPTAHDEPRADETEVRAVAQAYLDGLLNGDVPTLRSAFHPDTRFEGVVGEALVTMSFEDWAESRRDKVMRPVEDYRHSIEDVLIADDAAVVRVDIDWPGTYFVDYLSLLRIDGEWTIVNKTWTQRPSPRALSRIEDHPIPAEELAAFVGTYEVDGDEALELSVTAVGSRLNLGVRGQRWELYAQGGDAFAPEFDVDARIRFERSGAGVITGMKIALEDKTVAANRRGE